MSLPPKLRAIGITTGVAVFMAIALFLTIAAEKPSAEKSLAPSPIPESIIAPAEQFGEALAAVAAHIKPAVVSVYSEKMVKLQPQESPFGEFPFGEDFFDQLFGRQRPQAPHHQRKEYSVPQRGMGSGMILDTQGHILTNYHVVSEVDEIKVQLADKRRFEAKMVGVDPKTDVAVLKIIGHIPENLPTVELGDSDALKDGALVMAVGAPFGLIQTVTHGIISARGRSDVGIAAYEDFLQTDAAINPGNSGGPLVNMRGEVIGMNSAIVTGASQFGGEGQSSGVGFAIPSNMIKAMLPTLIKGGQITRGRLGVIIQDVTKELATQFHLPNAKGALVSQINKNSPAEKAGLKVGDVIVRVGNKDVEDTRQLRNFIAATMPGTNLKIVVIRNSQEHTLDVTIGKLQAEPTASLKPSGKAADQLSKLGLSLQAVTPELAQQFKLPETEKGILITEVNQGSPASTASLHAGDLIIEANHQRITNLVELQTALSKSKDQVLFLVKRNETSLFVLIQY